MKLQKTDYRGILSRLNQLKKSRGNKCEGVETKISGRGEIWEGMPSIVSRLWYLSAALI